LALICSKQKYRLALISLEAISDEVHTQRRLRHERLQLPLRTPGVGAEHENLDLDDELSDMPSATLGQYPQLDSQLNNSLTNSLFQVSAVFCNQSVSRFFIFYIAVPVLFFSLPS